MTSFTSMRAAAVTLGACAALAACAKKDATNDSLAMGASAAATTTTAAGGAMADSMNMAPKMTMTDADIVAMVSAINQGEVDAGNMAKAKATNKDVKDFADDMAEAHSKMLNEGKELATKAAIAPNTSAAADINAANKAMGDKLAATAKGPAFDKAYVDGQVAGHQDALAKVQAAAAAATNPDLKKMLNDAAGDVQKHLDRAKELQTKMGSAM